MPQRAKEPRDPDAKQDLIELAAQWEALADHAARHNWW
jgi:hypothetical protein